MQLIFISGLNYGECVHSCSLVGGVQTFKSFEQSIALKMCSPRVHIKGLLPNVHR